jgi:carbohydrate-binding DOMON domain-containing protein
VQGRATPGRTLRLVLDGDSTRAPTTTADARGRWQATLDTRALVDARVPHRVLAWDTQANSTSAAHVVRVTRAWQTLLDQADPAGDDHGPAGSGLRLAYPTDGTWGANRQMDLRRVRVAAAGDALQIELQMPRITRSWNPPNGFDHVAFTVFIEAPGRDDGQRAMPLQGGDLPDGMRWHWRLRVHGWSNALYDSRGASATNEGTAVSPGAAIQVDTKRHTLRLTLPGGLLGQTDGARLYVTTWDYDGGYRDLQPTAGGHHMGGGPGPKVMDDFGPVRLPSPAPRR